MVCWLGIGFNLPIILGVIRSSEPVQLFELDWIVIGFAFITVHFVLHTENMGNMRRKKEEKVEQKIMTQIMNCFIHVEDKIKSQTPNYELHYSL